MAISFSDFLIISEIFYETELNEGVWADAKAAIKNKLAGKDSKATDGEVEKTIGSLKQSSQSRDFQKRKADRLNRMNPNLPRGTRPTVNHSQKEPQDLSGDELSDMASARKIQAQKRRLAFESDGQNLSEAMNFVVSYKLLSGGSLKKIIIKGRNAIDAERKFKDMHRRVTLISITPESNTI